MSQLKVSANGQTDFYLNVLSITSPIYGQMNAAQTKGQIQYFPIKVHQPEVQFNLIFPNETTWEDWQVWVRTNMVNSQSANNIVGNVGVTLNWPQRSINDWSGVIQKQKAGGRRWNYTPRDSVTVQLANSLVSQTTTFGSFGVSAWQAIFGAGANTDTLFQLPEALQSALNTGQVNPIGGSVGANTTALNTVSNTVAGLIPGINIVGPVP